MFKALILLITPLALFALIFTSTLGAINVALRRNESNIDEYDDSVMDPTIDMDPVYSDGLRVDFIVTTYFPDSPDDPMGGNDTCADGTKYFRDANLPPERNLFAKTPDGRIIQGVCAIVQDMHSPVIPWDLKSCVTLDIPAYNPASEIHDHFATCVTDSRRLDLAMSGREQQKAFFSNLEKVCPEARPYKDPGGSNYNNGTLMPVLVSYLESGISYADLSPARRELLTVALAQQGKPYVWGAAGPNAFDCSGLVLYCYSEIGNSVPNTHNTNSQVREGRIINPSEALPGDCIYFGSSGNYNHTGIYLGEGKYIHAPHSGDVVKISSLNNRRVALWVRFMDPEKDSSGAGEGSAGGYGG